MEINRLVIGNKKHQFVYITVLNLIYLLIFPFNISAQSAGSIDENPLLSFSIDQTPIYVGTTFTLHLNVENISDLAGWQCDIVFDPDVLEASEVVNSTFLDVANNIAFFQSGTIDNTAGTITGLSAARIYPGGVNGSGRILSITFTAKSVGEGNVTLTNLHAGTSGISETIPLDIPEILIVVEDQLNINEPTFTFSTDVTLYRIGETFTLHLNANDITNFSRWQGEILFDSNVVEAIEVIEGDFLKNGNASTVFLQNTIDNMEGKISSLGTIRLNPDGVSGSGRVLSVVFLPKSIGQAQVSLTNLFAYSSESIVIPISIPEIVISISDVRSVNLFFSIDEIPVRVGDTFNLNLNVEDTTDFAGWLCDIIFDPSYFEVVEINEGNFLKKEGRMTFFLQGTIDNTIGKISSLGSIGLSKEGVSGTGKLLSVTLIAKSPGESEIGLTNLHAGSSDLMELVLSIPEFVITVEERVYLHWDVNQDGEVNIFDLMQVAQYLGEDTTLNPEADVDKDGTIGILDLIAVAQHIDESTTSAPNKKIHRDINLNPVLINSDESIQVMIKTWITRLQSKDDGSVVFRRAIGKLKRLLISLNPEKTMLLANYPNPFNPETWIPYHLAEPANVKVTIYSVNGTLVRLIAKGYQDAGTYNTHKRAIYWDGKNNLGESVASGVYFYTLIAGEFTATRKMLIKQ